MAVFEVEQIENDVDRIKSFLQQFQDNFGATADHVIRVPGRVNLIGEHIDYCGYAVHPMAIEQDIIVGIKRCESGLDLVNQNKDHYKPYKLDSLKNIEISTDKIHWWSYFLCGLKGVYEEMKIESPSGLQVYVVGQIPPSAGLSSSSAVVVSAAVSALVSNDLTLDKSELASLCARAERFIGTQGGGMDQAIEILAVEGQAKLIEFNPLKAHDVQLPEGAVFVVANSLQEKNKAASNEFNSRVVECRLATKILARRLLQGDDWRNLTKLKDVQTKSGNSLEEMIKHVETILNKQEYKRDDILKELDISDSDLSETILTNNTRNLQSFKLNQRARHVYSESSRVYKFRDICHQGSGDGCLKTLGELMTASHVSCRDDYECSAPKLDELVNTALKLGAYGSRLTGAGWGGCAVSLVPVEKVDSFMAGLKTEFYEDVDMIGNVAFITKPGSGLRVWKA